MFVDDLTIRAEENPISSLPGSVREIRIFDVSGIVDLIESVESQKLFSRIGAGTASCVEHGDVVSPFIYSVRRRVPHMNTPENQCPEGLAGFFANLGVVVVEDL